MSEATYVAYAAAYDNVADAEADFATLKEAGLRHITAAIVAKDDKGRVHVHEKTYAGKAAGAAGVIGGVVLGAIFPPAGIAVLTDAAVGGVALGTIGHFAGGLSRHDLKQLGDLIDGADHQTSYAPEHHGREQQHHGQQNTDQDEQQRIALGGSPGWVKTKVQIANDCAVLLFQFDALLDGWPLRRSFMLGQYFVILIGNRQAGDGG